MFYIGIDPSLSSTGIVVLDKNSRLMSSTLIQSNLKGTERLIELRNLLRECIRRVDSPRVLIERYSFGSRAGQAFSIGEWGGVLRVLLVESGHEVVEVSPSTLKKFITGKGNVKKDMILKEVFKKWDEDFNDDNLADAYGLARMNWSIDRKEDLLKYEKDCIKVIMDNKNE